MMTTMISKTTSNTTLIIESCLIWLYILMTIAKVIQLIIHLINSFFSSRKKKSKDDQRQRIKYKPTLQAATTMVNFIAQTTTTTKQGSNIEDIPRKEYQILTDPLLQQYTAKYSHGKPKKFTSLYEAKKSFYQEFTGEIDDDIIWFLNSSIVDLATLQLASPLGLLWFVYVIPWFVCSSLALLYEKFIKSRNHLSWAINVAIAATIVDVYVVCCKHKITFDEGIRKYKWMDMLTKEQIHPLIGTHICPIYKRDVKFRPDIMDFDFMVIENQNSLTTLYQKTNNNNNNNTYHRRNYHYYILLLPVVLSAIILLSSYVLLFVVVDYNKNVSSSGWEETVTMIMNYYFVDSVSIGVFINNIFPYAVLFYSIRFFVDTAVGTTWDNCWAP